MDIPPKNKIDSDSASKEPKLSQLDSPFKEVVIKAAQVIKNADAILFTSGAGLGVDSGLPDFRGPQGFWKAYPPMAKLGLQFQEMSNPTWFVKDPTFAWGFWSHRYYLYKNTQPHYGFQIMKKWTQMKHDRYFCFTSNVDGHWEKAGFPSERIYECHGSVHYMQCLKACTKEIWPTSEFNIPPVDESTFRACGELPKCKRCSELARPNVLMFNDWGYLGIRQAQQRQRFSQWLNKVMINQWRVVIIEIGAGKAVPTVRMTSEDIASELNGAVLIRINPTPGDDEVPEGHISLRCGGLNALQLLQQALDQLPS